MTNIAERLMCLSQFNPKTLKHEQFDAIRHGMRITLPNGTEWDLSVDQHTGDLTIMHPGLGIISIMPSVTNVITIRIID